MSLVQKKLSEDRVDGIADLISNIVNPVYREKAAEVTDLVIERFRINDQEEGAKKMGATRDLFKAEFEERDNKIAELTKEVESNKKELESQKSFIEKLKAEVVKLGGNVAML